MATKSKPTNLDLDLNTMEVGQTAALSLALLASGGFMGIEFTANVVLAADPSAFPPWVGTIETARIALLGLVTVSFAVVLALEHHDE